jgi:hypothetical protein
MGNGPKVKVWWLEIGQTQRECDGKAIKWKVWWSKSDERQQYGDEKAIKRNVWWPKMIKGKGMMIRKRSNAMKSWWESDQGQSHGDQKVIKDNNKIIRKRTKGIILE